MANSIVVQAMPEEVQQALAGVLTKEELSSLTFAPREVSQDDFGPNPKGEQVIIETVITFTAHAIAGGILYDLVKSATLALRDKFGKDKVKEE